jgi:hypothetical protein
MAARKDYAPFIIARLLAKEVASNSCSCNHMR